MSTCPHLSGHPAVQLPQRPHGGGRGGRAHQKDLRQLPGRQDGQVRLLVPGESILLPILTKPPMVTMSMSHHIQAGLFRRKKRVLSLPAKRQTSSSSSSSTASRPSRLISGQDRMAEDNLDGLYSGKDTQTQSHGMNGGADRDSFDRRRSSRLAAAQHPNPLRHSVS
jgi:hypothetical protein